MKKTLTLLTGIIHGWSNARTKAGFVVALLFKFLMKTRLEGE